MSIYSVNILSVCLSVMLQKALLLMDVFILVFYAFVFPSVYIHKILYNILTSITVIKPFKVLDIKFSFYIVVYELEFENVSINLIFLIRQFKMTYKGDSRGYCQFRFSFNLKKLEQFENLNFRRFGFR